MMSQRERQYRMATMMVLCGVERNVYERADAGLQPLLR